MPDERKQFGATGEFPRGQLGPDDEGALRMGVAHDSEGNVIINFGKELSWVGMPPEQAIEFAKLIIWHAGGKRITVEF